MQQDDGIPILTEECPHLCRPKRQVLELAPKAAKWDLLRVTAHRFGVSIKEVIEFIEEKVRNR